MLIVGAIEPEHPRPPAAHLLGHFVETAADPDAIAKTDGWSGYAAVPGSDVVGKAGVDPPSLLQPQRWARGVYHGLRRGLICRPTQFVFRFNRRKTRHAAFRSLFRIATNAEPLTYSMLIEPEA